jgi:hypothetical protein
MMTILERYNECVNQPWVTGGQDIQYSVVRSGDSARVFFQGTDPDSLVDIINDIDFLPHPYKDAPIPWRVHGGFLRGFKSVIDIIAPQLEGVKKIYVAGFSAGAAYATLMHEWAWYNIAPDVESWAFGAPRVLFMPSKEIASRFENFHRVTVRGDIVSMVPAWWMGFKHVGQECRIGPWSLPSWKKHISPSYPEALRDF